MTSSWCCVFLSEPLVTYIPPAGHAECGTHVPPQEGRAPAGGVMMLRHQPAHRHTGAGWAPVESGVFGACLSARCTVDESLMDPACGGKGPRRVIRRFDRALRLIDRVATSSGDKTRRLLRRERRVLLQAAAMGTVSATAKERHN